ncbi:MAG TPA: hypothetical protein DCW68_07135 [Rhodospirillaceae bacterium]|nr:MAG: hypothetical protein A2018_06645 [Alphaproteobacteria bacterium GWF2_58_20]HAU29862.1 hypothetical protein [Rhodospirillaceae bacterium]
MHETEIKASGVQELIDRLRDQGAASGRAEAERIIHEAREQAHEILKRAKEDAHAIVTEAEGEAQRNETAGEEALKLAVRDSFLHMKEQVTVQFRSIVGRLVSLQMKDPEFLRRLILEVARKSAEEQTQGRPFEVLLPKDVVGLDDLRQNPEEIREGGLSHLVAQISADMLREGIEVRVGDGNQPGIMLKLKDEDLVIDLTDQAIASYLQAHLLPRFRALLDGIVH